LLVGPSLGLFHVHSPKRSPVSRFTSWIVEQSQGNPDVMKGYLTAVLKLMMEDNKKVQEASCSALSKVCNDGVDIIENYITDVVQVT